MLKKILLYKLFIGSMAISPFLAFFSGSGILSYGAPITLAVLITALELSSPFSTKIKYWMAILLWLPFILWSSLYYIANPFLGLILTEYSITIITLLFILIAFIRLKDNMGINEYINFNYKLILFFCIGQIIVCLGQISTYSFGIGFPVNKEYSYAISGTYFNPNNLSAIILIISYIYAAIENLLPKKNPLIWILIIFLLVITASRSAILVVTIIFLLSRGLSLKGLLFSSFIFTIIYFLFFVFLVDANNDVILRFSGRFSSLVDTLENVSGDESSSLRLDSYLHFLKNLNNLGFGSGELGNYFKYSGGANFSTGLLFRNPHSLIVEIGYWLGLPGLITFLIGIAYLFRFSEHKGLLFIVLITSSLIPSTVLNSPAYFLFMIQCFFIPSVKEYYLLKNRIS